MKKYELVHINKGIKFSRDKELIIAQDLINEKAAEGWELLQILSPNDIGGAMYAVFFKEVEG